MFVLVFFYSFLYMTPFTIIVILMHYNKMVH